ncbi:MAG: DUF2087 domain-containing protein [Spirochaetia bacterium]
MNIENTLDQTDLVALLQGFKQTAEHYKCVYCDAEFEEGIIYPSESHLMDARRAAAVHVQDAHGGPFKALLHQDRRITGLTELQVELLGLLHAGYSDAEIARMGGGKAESTIRNHRFQLRKRTREAKVLCTLMELLDIHSERKKAAASDFYQFAGPLTVDDERVVVTNREAEKIKNKYLRVHTMADNRTIPLELVRWPKKQKEKLVVLDYIARLLEPDREYSEPAVNAVLSEVDEDYVTLRRYLVDYGLLLRQPGGGAYRRSSR